MNDKFTKRVLLHYGDDEDYETLHREMEKEGFSRTIINNDGTEYHLPQAEYNKIGSYSGETVRASASRATAVTGRKFAFLVTPSTGRYWTGLDNIV
jgi:hypothetical protein